MIQPPFQLPDGGTLFSPQVTMPSPPERGFPLVWVAIGGLLALLAVGALIAIVNPPGLSGDQLKIHRALADAEAEWGLLPSGPDKSKASEIIAKLESLEIADIAAKGTLARALLILKQRQNPASEPNFDGLTDLKGKSKDALTPGAETTKDIAEINAALSEVYSGASLTPEDGERVVDTLTANEPRWPMDLAIARVRASPPVGGNDDDATRKAILGIVGLVAVALGVLALALIAIKPRPLGLPVSGSKADGDRLGLRFLLFLASMLGVGVFLATLQIAKVPIGQGMMLLLASVVLIATILLILWLPIGGKSYSLKDIGIRSEHLGQDCLYGIIAFFANLPAVIALALFGLFFLRWIPSGGHPIQSEMLDLRQLPLLVLAAGPLTAFVEEISFRGMLFQGLALRFKVWPAIIMSSLGFSMIHPQGGALWLSLAWIGGMGAYLTYQRKSLIPAMVMHACHNSVLIVLYAFTVG